MQEAGFEIRKKVYPFPQRFKPADCVLVEQLTNLTWMEFVDRLPDVSDDQMMQMPDDPVVQLGMMGVAISQTNPGWSRERVVKFINGVFMDEISVVGPEVEDDGSADPLDGTNGSTGSEQPAKESKSASVSPPGPSRPKPSGVPV